MKTKETIHIIMGLVFAAALITALLTASAMVFAQISPQPTATWTIGPATATNTPPFTPTETSPPPTNTPLPPTNTPPPPTNTPTPAPIPPPALLGSFSIVPLEGVAQVDTPIDFTVVFTDPDDIINPGFATFAWGDGDTSTCPPDGTTACWIDLGVAGADQVTSSPAFTVGEVKGRHAYSEPGVYTVQLTVRDEFGQFDTATYEFVIVYDPSGGFVTGGGWINSPTGAYKPDPTLTGKATFGFVSKYKKGASVPTGKTEFQFQVADLKFHSDSYQWLVVNQNGSRAQFKGEGTINGAVAPGGDNYQFMIWAIDGDPDTFRIKIWYMDGDNMVVVYDNEVAQAIGGGSIVVHTAKRSSR
jgi:hypothetical protein